MRKVFKAITMFCAILGIIFAIGGVSWAQTTRGELAGNVTDPSGALIPGAKVVVTNAETGEKSDTVSSSSGSYHFTELSIGRYNVTVTAAGFSSRTVRVCR
jgi:Carboxypeptidase regulatory-like domain